MRTRNIKLARHKIATKHIDWTMVDKMLRAGCTGVEVAARLGMHPETLYCRCEKEKRIEFTAYQAIKRSDGKALLREVQHEMAIVDKNPTIAIWLGKQDLDQREPESRTIEACRPALLEYLEMLKKPKAE